MTLRQRWYSIIFKSDTKKGRIFDEILLIAIVVSVIILMFDSITSFRIKSPTFFNAAEWFFTILFTIEYISRICVHPRPVQYIFSFYGIIDFLSTIPTYVGLFLAGTSYMIVFRIFRLFRVFRILKLGRFTTESARLWEAIKSAIYKITTFFLALSLIVVFLGTIMYVVEGEENGFRNIPESIYWAVITITTVGYGDIVPHTVAGKLISSIAMVIGYSIIAIPTGIVTAEIAKSNRSPKKKCPSCKTNNKLTANYCNNCGYHFLSEILNYTDEEVEI